MSTQTVTLDLLGQTCATTQEVEARLCIVCGTEFIPNKFHHKQKCCSRACQHNASRGMHKELERELRQVAKNAAFVYLNKFRYMAFDGRYEGPYRRCETRVVFKKDTGFHAMPIDVHLEPAKPKFNMVTPEDVDWGKKQGRPAQPRARMFKAFCANCVDMVIDESKNEVRVTKGVYLPIEHDCAAVRVYNLSGELLEVKAI